MAAMSDYLESILLEHIMNENAYAVPEVWFALFTAAPSDAGGGTEVTGGAYARKQVDSAVTDQWTVGATSGIATNDADITFASATANWGTVTHVGIFDAVTAGNLLLHGILTNARTVNDGDTFEFAIGDFTVTFA